jgi:AbiU2
MASSELESVLEAVHNQLIELSLRWKIFCQLFDRGPENIELLNKSGSDVFGLFQRLVLDDTILSIGRLTDPEKTSKFENASIKNLVAKAKAHLSTAAMNNVEVLVAKLKDQVGNARAYRDKALAHMDLYHASNKSALPPLTYDELENAMKTLREIVSKVASEACQQTIPHEVIIRFGRGGDYLLEILKRGHNKETGD